MTIRTIGRYKIINEVGRGGMANVYHAHDPDLDREVAIKILPAELLRDPKFLSRFEREAHALTRLEHPAIVPIYDTGEDNRQPYIVMRHMAGGTLGDRLETGPLKLQEISPILRRIAAALDEAHKQGIIHRDLKPSNILFDHNGHAYLSDFGIAKLSEGTASLTGSRLIGTPAYMSPEQVHGDRDLDERSDVYSLGILLFQMLTGQQPYQATTPVKQMMSHVLDPVPRILDVAPLLDPELDPILVTVLAKDRNDRYSNPNLLADAIELITPKKPEILERVLDVPSDPALKSAQPAEALPVTPNVSIDSEITVDDLRKVQPAPPITKQKKKKTKPQRRRRKQKPNQTRRWIYALSAVLGLAALSGMLWMVINTRDSAPNAEVIASPEIPLETSTISEITAPTALPTIAAALVVAEEDLPALSDVAGLLSFSTNRTGNWEIFLMQPGANDSFNLTNSPGDDGYPSWSPDGKKLAFASDRSGQADILIQDFQEKNTIGLFSNLPEDIAVFSGAVSNFTGVTSIRWEDSQEQLEFIDSTLPLYYYYLSLEDYELDGRGTSLLAPKGLSPDKKLVVDDKLIDGNWEIVLSDVDRTYEFNITEDMSDDRRPVWSPDGNYIAFQSNRDGNWEIYVMAIDGSNLLNLTNDPGDDVTPSWQQQDTLSDEQTFALKLPNELISFASDRTGDWDIFVIEPGGPLSINISDNPGEDDSPSWSPDGQKIAFASNSSGQEDILIYDFVVGTFKYAQIHADTLSEFTKVSSIRWTDTQEKIEFIDARWPLYYFNFKFADAQLEGRGSSLLPPPGLSPDGSLIVKDVIIEGNWEVVLSDAAKTFEVNLTTHIADDRNPVWSPDGKYIAFQSNRDVNWEIYVMAVDGSDLINLTNDPGNDVTPSWQPSPTPEGADKN